MRGQDYPYGYVRWTEQRNMRAVLQLMATGKLDVSPLVTHRFEIEHAERAYDLIKTGSEPYLGILLRFPVHAQTASRHTIQLKPAAPTSQIEIGCLGAGGFARGVLLPAIRQCKKARLRILCSASGLSATVSGEKLGFEQVCSDEDTVATHPHVNTAFIVTRHNLHASQVIKCLQNGKHTFVEKPLALTVAELAAIEATLHALGDKAPLLMVGFNRRFSPAARRVKQFFSAVSSPLTVSIRFNAGQIPADHWTQDLSIGGGRLIGEACHAIDLATYLVGAPVARVFAESIGGPNAPAVTDDQCFITLRHANGSVSNVAYLSGGDRDFPKERIEVLGGERLAVIDDFREVILSQNGKQTVHKSAQDKGHNAEIAAFLKAIQIGATAPISWAELKSTTLTSILAVRSLREGFPQETCQPIDVDIADADNSRRSVESAA
jgi:predicted dehydrogenase